MDWTSIIIASIGVIGTITGAVMAQRKTTALILYRLDEIEKKQDIQNKLIDRVYNLEERVKVLEVKNNE